MMAPPRPHEAPRGACPSLEAPMAVADGLLVRLRPARGFLSPEELTLLGRSAMDLGNGRVEVSLRGSVQLRGLTSETAEALRARLDAAGLAVATGLVVEHSPLAGRDPEEQGDPRPLIARLDAVVREAPKLAPKVSLTVSAGGRYDLSGQKADIAAVMAAPGRWRLLLAGSPLGVLDEADVPGMVADLLARIGAAGPGARAKDIRMATLNGEDADLPASPVPAPGPVRLRDGGTALALAVPFGQASGTMLEALGKSVSDARLHFAPHRHLVIVGAIPEGLDTRHFWTRVDAPGLRLTLCSGAVRTAHGVVHTADIARLLLDVAPEIADGSLHLHSATCVKGCGFAGRPGVRVTTPQGRLALSPHPHATDAPLAWVRENAMEEDLAAFARGWRGRNDCL